MNRELRIKMAELSVGLLGILMGLTKVEAMTYVSISLIALISVYIAFNFHLHQKLKDATQKHVGPIVDTFYKMETCFKEICYKVSKGEQLSPSDLEQMQGDLEAAIRLYENMISWVESDQFFGLIGANQVRNSVNDYYAANGRGIHLPAMEATIRGYRDQSTREAVDSIVGLSQKLTKMIIANQALLDAVSGFKISVEGMYYITDESVNASSGDRSASASYGPFRLKYSPWRFQPLVLRTEMGLIMADISFVLLAFSLAVKWE